MVDEQGSFLRKGDELSDDQEEVPIPAPQSRHLDGASLAWGCLKGEGNSVFGVA